MIQLPEIPLSPLDDVVSDEPNPRPSQGPDPIIKRHEYHWRACIESYQAPSNRLQRLGVWELLYSDTESCIYHLNNLAVIIGFRGTAATKDLYDDIRIVQGKIFPRAEQAINTWVNSSDSIRNSESTSQGTRLEAPSPEK